MTHIFAQRRPWFLDRMDTASAVYNVPTAMRVRGALALDQGALRRAHDEAVLRHQVPRRMDPDGMAQRLALLRDSTVA